MRQIEMVVEADEKTARNDLAKIAEKSVIDLPEPVERKGGGIWPRRRVQSPRSLSALLVTRPAPLRLCPADRCPRGDDAYRTRRWPRMPRFTRDRRRLLA